jgi:hypothetical protein
LIAKQRRHIVVSEDEPLIERGVEIHRAFGTVAREVGKWIVEFVRIFDEEWLAKVANVGHRKISGSLDEGNFTLPVHALLGKLPTVLEQSGPAR